MQPSCSGSDCPSNTIAAARPQPTSRRKKKGDAFAGKAEDFRGIVAYFKNGASEHNRRFYLGLPDWCHLKY
jgi:hypothetical protein